MRYSIKIIAIILALALSSEAFAQRLADEDKPVSKENDMLKATAIVVGVTLAIVGSRYFIKHINKKAAREAAAKAAREKKKIAREAKELRLAEKARRARKETRREQRRVERKNQRKQERQAARKTARREERTRVKAEKLKEEMRRANEIRTAEEHTAAVISKHAAVIEHGEALQQAARDGHKMSFAELRSIYEGRIAALEVEKAQKLEAIHKQYPDNYTPEEIDAALQKRDEELAKAENIFMIEEGINTAFNKKYPKHVAMQSLEEEYRVSLEYWNTRYDTAKNLTNGVPEVKYAPEFANQISAIISTTSHADELSALVKVGNLQEVIWRLAEHGFTAEATAMQRLIEDVLTNAKIINIDVEALSIGATKPLLLEFDNGLKGVFKGDNGQYNKWSQSYDWPQREIAAYRLDQLLGLNVFPITVPRRLGNHTGGGSVQLFIDGVGGDFYQQYASYFTLIGKELPSGSDKIATKNRTFFALTMDRDTDAYVFNNIQPLVGRLIKIDAEQAFYPLYGNIGEDMLKKPENFYTNADFIARLDKITLAQLKEIFQPLFAAEKAEVIVKDLHTNIRNYVDVVKSL